MNLVWNSSDWIYIAAAFVGILLVLLFVSYRHASAASPGLRLTAATLKALGIVLLALCLLEPHISDRRARPGANQFILLADNSQSMRLKDDKSAETRGQRLKEIAGKDSTWIIQLAKDFEVRQFAFDSQLRSVAQFDDLPFDGRTSDLGATLERLITRYEGQPLAGIFVFTDGSATDAALLEQIIARTTSMGKGKLPPIFPVVVGGKTSAIDVSLEQVTVTQTNFEDAPVTLTANITATSLRGKTLTAELLDDADKTIETQTLRVDEDGKPITVRFKVKPENPGLSFYKVRAYVEGQKGQFAEPETTTEATIANNARLVAVDRGRGPYRVLYISGRPNWEYKFLNRAVESDKQVELVGYIRIAKREPKFNFLGRLGDPSNPLWRGFENKDGEQVESFDKPVIMRLNTENEEELRGGFPLRAEELFKYHAIILDDVEAEFFTQDQMQLIKEFVRTRGGGLLMLGGQESYKNGKYDRTPIGDMLPVYADASSDLPVNARFRMALTREGWLETWVRLQSEEDAEKRRLDQMPSFHTLNPVRGIKPGATVLARAQIEGQDGSVPALVEQRFGTGRVGALLLGDLWRWDMRRPANAESDLSKAWRQTIRWLVAEVPRRVNLATEPAAGNDEGAMQLTVQVRDEAYAPLDNAGVAIKVTGPDGKAIELRAEPSAGQPGRYEAIYVPRLPGAYRVSAMAMMPDGSPAGEALTGWTSDPAAEEFRVLQPNRPLLEKIAKSTGGQLVELKEVESFAKTLPSRESPVMEQYNQPFWHKPWIFLIAIALLAGEWGLRRWKGLP